MATTTKKSDSVLKMLQAARRKAGERVNKESYKKYVAYFKKVRASAHRLYNMPEDIEPVSYDDYVDAYIAERLKWTARDARMKPDTKIKRDRNVNRTLAYLDVYEKTSPKAAKSLLRAYKELSATDPSIKVPTLGEIIRGESTNLSDLIEKDSRFYGLVSQTYRELRDNGWAVTDAKDYISQYYFGSP